MKIRIGLQVDAEVMERWQALAAAAGQTRTQWLESAVRGAGSDKRHYVVESGPRTKDLAASAAESDVGTQDIVVETSKTHAPERPAAAASQPAQAASSRPAFVSYPKPKDARRK